MDKIETKPYGPDITSEERDVLLQRVYMFSDDTVIWHEVPIATNYQLEMFGEKMLELTRNIEKFYMIIDLSAAERPSAETIETLRKIMKKFQGLKHAAVYTGKNFMLNIAAKFVLGRMGFLSYSIHKTQEDALKSIQNARE